MTLTLTVLRLAHQLGKLGPDDGCDDQRQEKQAISCREKHWSGKSSRAGILRAAGLLHTAQEGQTWPQEERTAVFPSSRLICSLFLNESQALPTASSEHLQWPRGATGEMTGPRK